jgi:hypothetical protein
MNTEPPITHAPALSPAQRVAAACRRLEASRRQLQLARARGPAPSLWQQLVQRHPVLLTVGGLLVGALVVALKPWRAASQWVRAWPTVMATVGALATVLPWTDWLVSLVDKLRPEAADPPPS